MCQNFYESKLKIDFIGFHGQTIFHDSKMKLTKQIDGKLLSQITNKIVIVILGPMILKTVVRGHL